MRNSWSGQAFKPCTINAWAIFTRWTFNLFLKEYLSRVFCLMKQLCDSKFFPGKSVRPNTSTMYWVKIFLCCRRLAARNMAKAGVGLQLQVHDGAFFVGSVTPGGPASMEGSIRCERPGRGLHAVHMYDTCIIASEVTLERVQLKPFLFSHSWHRRFRWFRAKNICMNTHTYAYIRMHACMHVHMHTYVACVSA